MPDQQTDDQSELTELSEVSAPSLPPLWAELGRAVGDKWPLPTFIAGVVALGLFLWLKPEREDLRSWQEYVSDARRAFAEAQRAQDEHGEIVRALEFLAGEDVSDLARARWREVRKARKAGTRACKYTHRVHGVLPSYDRAVIQGGETVLTAQDLGFIGEAYYRLATIKQEYPETTGRSIALEAPGLYRRAAEKLEAAAESAARLEGREWRRRRRMWAECQAYLGEDRKALRALDELVGKMNVAEARQLRREKDPSGGEGGVQGRPVPQAGRDVEEWAKIYELLARCYARRGENDAAARYYRMFLEQGTGGELAHRVRVRLAELTLAESIAEQAVQPALAGFAEVVGLCRQVEQSDAKAELREQATFLRGRAAYRAGDMRPDPVEARRDFAEAVNAFRFNYSPSRPYLDMSRVLLARALFLGGQRQEAEEILDGILRVGAAPAIYACAEVSYADAHVDTAPAKAVGGRMTSKPQRAELTLAEGERAEEVLGMRVRDLDGDQTAALGLERGGALIYEVRSDGPARDADLREGDIIVRLGRREVTDAADLFALAARFRPGTRVHVLAVRPEGESGLTHGYMDAIRRIRRLADREVAALVPELSELLEDEHFVMLQPQPDHKPPAGQAHLLHIARAYSDLHEFDEAARIYAHILRAYPAVAKDRYSFLLGELYAAKAERLTRLKERRRALLASARAFMQVSAPGRDRPGEEASPFAANAYWEAGRNYSRAGRYDGASQALGEFTRRFGDDPRIGEGLYLLGQALRHLGDGARAAAVFGRCSVEHRNDQFGYLSHLALGETYMEMGLLDRLEGEKGEAATRNAVAVFESIRRDARYTPESLVWMKALYLLGQTHYLIGRRGLMWAGEMELAANDDGVIAKAEERLETMRKLKVHEALIAREERWVKGLREARKGEAAVARAQAEARRHLRRSAEVLAEAHERYPPDTFGQERPSFREFLDGQRLASRRTVAMVHFLLGEAEPAEYEKAHRGFSEILVLTKKIGTLDRIEAEEHRREAFVFKGIIEMRVAAGKPAGYLQAAATFHAGFDEFARTPDGPWFCFAAGVALEKSGDRKRAERKYADARAAYENLGETGPRKVGLAAERWEEHSRWVLDTLAKAKSKALP
jgi:tetratricopeptide (TPR) repeat protein